jgi:hypothetical protein
MRMRRWWRGEPRLTNWLECASGSVRRKGGDEMPAKKKAKKKKSMKMK